MSEYRNVVLVIDDECFGPSFIFMPEEEDKIIEEILQGTDKRRDDLEFAITGYDLRDPLVYFNLKKRGFPSSYQATKLMEKWRVAHGWNKNKEQAIEKIINHFNQKYHMDRAQIQVIAQQISLGGRLKITVYLLQHSSSGDSESSLVKTVRIQNRMIESMYHPRMDVHFAAEFQSLMAAAVEFVTFRVLETMNDA
jgi:hypothetical protein